MNLGGKGLARGNYIIQRKDEEVADSVNASLSKLIRLAAAAGTPKQSQRKPIEECTVAELEARFRKL